MTKEFLTSNEVFITKGYLSSNKNKVQPIYNPNFINTQSMAKYVITFAEKAKGRNFKTIEADSLEELKQDVMASLATNDIEYIKAPKEVARPITKKLADEALAFIANTEDVNKTTKINRFMQRFNIIGEFEEIGLFFEQEIIKIDKIYTIAEITKAVTEYINLLG